MKSALFIGRFQPLHHGHLAVIKMILEKHDHLIIVIGSAETFHTKHDPLTAGERFELINETLKAEKISQKKYSIIPVRDINSPKWMTHLNSYLPPYDTLYTGSTEVKKHFKAANSKVKIISLKRLQQISASKIRQLIATNKPWEHLVPTKVAELLKKWKTVPND